jgi:hypothetical protein
MTTCIYNVRLEIRFHPSADIFTLAVGLGFSAWYVNGIGAAITHDIRTFPEAFRESPVLTIIFAVFKLCGYVLFPCLFAVMVYGPIRNLFFKREISGRLVSLSANATKKRRSLSIELEHNQFVVPDPGGLEAAINDGAIKGDELRFVIGAFSRVLSVEKVT